MDTARPGVCDIGSSLAFHPKAVADRLHQNAAGFWIENYWAIGVLAAALLADAASTTHFMLDLGVAAELHPGVRAASAVFGPFAGPLIGAITKAAVAVLAMIYFKPFACTILVVTTISYFFAAWYNLWGIYLFV